MKLNKVVKFFFLVSCCFVLTFSFVVHAAFEGDYEEDFYYRVKNVYDTISDDSSKRPEYLGAIYYVSNRYGSMKYKDFTEDIITELFSYMIPGSGSYIISEDDEGNLSLENEEEESTEESTEENSEESTEENSEGSTENNANTTDNDSSKISNKVEFPKYKISKKDLTYLAGICKREQGEEAKPMAAEASLMANLFEYYNGKCPRGKGDCSTVTKFVKNSGWFNSSQGPRKVNDKEIAVVKTVLVDGKRTLPRYVVEHDCFDCNKKKCKDGKRGDICSLDNNGKKITSMSGIKNKKNYISGVTKIKSVYHNSKEYYTFYTFFSNKKDADPFGYTPAAFKKFSKYGDGHYNVDGSYTSGSGLIPEGEDSNTISSVIDLEYFKNQLIDNWFSRPEFEGYTATKKESMAVEVIEHVEEYKVLMGIKETETSSDGTCTYNVDGKTYSNPSIQLLECEGNTPLENTELVEFEKYTTGVVSQENGNGTYEGMKVQAVAARSYALTRERVMGKTNKFGVGFATADGQSVIRLRSCTLDQVYCDPDQGCWSKAKGGQTGDNVPDSECTVYQKEDKSKNWSKSPIPEDSKIRKAVVETRGQVAVDSSNNIVYTPYLQADQDAWNSMANQGKDYYEILKKHYPKVANVTANCGSSGNAEAETWKQGDPRWGSKKIGSRTLKAVGCMITSTAIQIARSGTKLTVSEFDPGVFLDTIKAHGGTNGNDFRYSGNPWSSIAPNFKYGGDIKVSGNTASMAEQLKQFTTGNKYAILRVKNKQHWVALTGIENGRIKMADPVSDATDAASKYNLPNPMRVVYFIKND